MTRMEDPPVAPADVDDPSEADEAFDVTPEEDDLMSRAWQQIQQGHSLTEEELWASLASHR